VEVSRGRSPAQGPTGEGSGETSRRRRTPSARWSILNWRSKGIRSRAAR
jgi:hypothetical protein